MNSIPFFEAYSKVATVRALGDAFEAPPTSSISAVLPFKILNGIIDREDILISVFFFCFFFDQTYSWGSVWVKQ